MIEGEDIREFANLLIVGALALRRSVSVQGDIDELVETALVELADIATSLERIGQRLLTDRLRSTDLQ